MNDPAGVELPTLSGGGSGGGASAPPVPPLPPPRVSVPIVLPDYDELPLPGDGRVVLRHWTQHDAPVIVAASRVAEMRRFRLLPGPHTNDTAHAFIAGCRNAWHGDRHALWLAVHDAADGAVVGGVHLLSVGLGSARAQIGYWTLPEHQRRGFATAAARLLAEWAFRELRIARITFETHATNAPSRRVATRLGCALEAVFRSHRELGDRRADCLLFGLLAGELDAGRPEPAAVADRDGRDSRDPAWPAGQDGTSGRHEPLDPHVERLLAGARSDRPAVTPVIPERQPTISDGSITLRPWRRDDDDLRACVAGCIDAETQRWLPQLPSPYTEHDGRAFLAMAETSWADQDDGHFAVVDAGGRHLGGARLRRAGDPAVAEIGYRVMPEARRRGVATGLARILSRWALDDLGLARVQIRAEMLNAASVGVARKAGFTREGILRGNELDRRGVRRDDVMFSLLPDDPR